MESNTDIIVLTSIIIVLFLVFIIATVRELSTASATDFTGKEEGGPRADMLRVIGKLFTDDRIDANKKVALMKAVKSVIEDLDPEDELK